MNKIILGVLGVIVIGGLAVAGRQATQRAGNAAVESAINHELQASGGGSVNVTNGNVEVTNSTGTGTVGYGSNVSLPANFPSDVPTPTGTLTTAYGGTESGSASYGLVYTILGNGAATAADTYQSQLKAAGFTIDAAGAYAANGSTISGFTATKGTWKVAVAVTASAGATNLTLTVTTQAAGSASDTPTPTPTPTSTSSAYDYGY